MNEGILGYREVIPDQTVLDTCKEITRNTGGTQGTLQDIKVAERANGFSYIDSTKNHTRNRFIYWRINHDVLELVEHSLDINLAGNRIRYKFVDTPILDGVSIHESYDSVIVLVPTVCSVHRLIFPHPDKYHRQDNVSDLHPYLAAPSIFSEARYTDALDPSTFHSFTNNTSSTQLPYLAASSLRLSDEEATFVLAYFTGEILLVKQSREGKIASIELKNDSIVPRFLSGLADKIRQKDKDGEITVSLLFHTFGLETYALTLSRNGNLKFWSCSMGECVAIIDILAENGCKSQQIHGAQNHVLRKSVDACDSNCFLAIYMSFSSGSLISIMQPIVNGAQVRLMRVNMLQQKQNDLIDLALCSDRIWSIWRGKDGENEAFSAQIQGEWAQVELESVPDASQAPNFDGELDPRQVYLQYIFQPGRFPLHVIGKALNIYKRSNVVTDLNLSAAHLKQQICMAVEEDIENEMKDTPVSDEDYLEYSNYCWQRFYSSCVQYHVTDLKPIGLLLLPLSSGAILLKKSMISFLRPFDLCDYFANENFLHNQILIDDTEINEDVLCLFNVLNYLDQQMSDDFGGVFKKELSLLFQPDLVMDNMLDKILKEMDKEFTVSVLKMIDKCSDLCAAIHKVLELLRTDSQLNLEDVDAPSRHSATNTIFGSQFGISMVAGCFRQQVQVRFNICRNLLLLITIMLKGGDRGVIADNIRVVCMPEAVVLTQTHYIMAWLASVPAMVNLSTEASMQRLSSLRLNPVFNLRGNSMNSVSLLELFMGSSGGFEVRKLFGKMKQNEESLSHWQFSLLPFLSCILHVISPLSETSIIYEWLLSCGQHLYLQQYARFLNTWCNWNNCTYNFFLAISYLVNGENNKALDLFKISAKGIGSEPFLGAHLLMIDDNPERAVVNYYLKVIYLFEVHKAYDCAISLANVALSCSDVLQDPLAATLYSIKFKHYLKLKSYEMAYEALVENPDAERRKDNLRDLVKNLLDERKLDVLMQFSYDGMEELFCDILFARARAADAANNIFYDFLYSYQIKRGEAYFRLAASVMYEQAYRLLQFSDPESLEKQVRCYLAAKNCLHLVEPKFAFIVMPLDQVDDKVVLLPPLAGSKDEPEEIVLKSEVKIIEIDDLKKELVFASAKLKLFRFNPRAFFEISAPHELVVLLTNSGLFKTALEIAKLFDVSYRGIFEALTKKCRKLGNHNEAWRWLMENNLQDLPSNTKSPISAVWNLLEDCINRYEEDKMSVIHKIVCTQLIKLNMWIPTWLLSSYKKRNPSELLRLFYAFGRLEEAVELSGEYMLAALGHGKEYYGLASSMQATTPAVCLPVRDFVMLIHQLKHINETNPEKPFLNDCEQLAQLLDKYLLTAHETSNQMCRFKSTISYSL